MSYYKIFILIGIITTRIAAYSSNPPEVKPDQASTPTKSNHSVFIGSGFGNDLLYDGSVQTVNQPFVSTDISYFFRGKLWTALTLYHLTHKDLLVPMADLSVGFAHDFNEFFDVSAAFSSYFTSAEVKQEIHENFSFFRVRAGYDWYWLYTTVTAGTILGKNKGWYLYFKNSRYFSNAQPGKSGSFSCNPGFNLVFGKTTYYEPAVQTKSFPGRPPGGGNQHPSPTEENQQSSLRWDLMKLELSLPISFHFNRVSLEAEPLFLIPGKRDVYKTNGMYFFLNLYYRVL